MTTEMRTVIVPVKDVEAARRLYATLLGIEPYTDEPYYVGFRPAGLEVGLDPNGHASGMTGPVCYWHVEDIRATVDTLVGRGADVQAEVRDVGGGRLVATIRDADGNPVGLLQDPAV